MLRRRRKRKYKEIIESFCSRSLSSLSSLFPMSTWTRPLNVLLSYLIFVHLKVPIPCTNTFYYFWPGGWLVLRFSWIIHTQWFLSPKFSFIPFSLSPSMMPFPLSVISDTKVPAINPVQLAVRPCLSLAHAAPKLHKLCCPANNYVLYQFGLFHASTKSPWSENLDIRSQFELMFSHQQRYEGCEPMANYLLVWSGESKCVKTLMRCSWILAPISDGEMPLNAQVIYVCLHVSAWCATL